MSLNSIGTKIRAFYIFKLLSCFIVHLSPYCDSVKNTSKSTSACRPAERDFLDSIRWWYFNIEIPFPKIDNTLQIMNYFDINIKFTHEIESKVRSLSLTYSSLALKNAWIFVRNEIFAILLTPPPPMLVYATLLHKKIIGCILDFR